MRPEVIDTVTSAIAESLAVPKEGIRPESRLIDDLGADSLDFVDIVFTLDQRLGIRVRETEFNFLTRLDFSSPEVMQNGFLTAAVVDRLASWLPALEALPDRGAVTPRALFSLITVESICIVADRKLTEMAAAGVAAG